MDKMDTVTFMEKNGKGFFESGEKTQTCHSEFVEITISIPIQKVRLLEIYSKCEEKDMSIEEFLAGVVERFLDDE